MIDGLKPYPAYKNSGVPWLGEVPEHWELKRGKWLFRHRKEINTQRTHTNILSLTLRGVVNNDPDDPEGLVPKDYATYQFFAKGDLVFKLIDLENLRTSRVGLVHEDGIMSSAYVRLVPNHSGVQRFFFHQYFDLYQRGIFNQLGAGVRSTLGPSDLLNVGILVPSGDEQSAMVRFLDHVDRRIRRYIGAKKKLIGLLNERKQAIIHRAVTRGLEPNVRLKLSGLTWTEQIPEHWSISRLGRLTSRIGDGLHGTPQYVDASPYHFINGNNLSSGKVQITQSTRCVSEDEYEKHKIYLDETTLLLSINGTIGSVAYYDGELIILGKSAAYINCGDKLSRRYLFFLLQSPEVGNLFRREATGTTILNLSLESVRHLPTLLPLLKEQSEIVSFLERRTSQLCELILKAEHEIELLREYRTRLIADVVTGKLDVREAAARLPEEADEPEPLEDADALAEGNEEGEGAALDAAPEEAEA